MLGPPPSREGAPSGDLELKGGVSVLVKILRSTWNTDLVPRLNVKQEVQDICERTALRAKKWSGFICKRAPEDTTLSR